MIPISFPLKKLRITLDCSKCLHYIYESGARVRRRKCRPSSSAVDRRRTFKVWHRDHIVGDHTMVVQAIGYIKRLWSTLHIISLALVDPNQPNLRTMAFKVGRRLRRISRVYQLYVFEIYWTLSTRVKCYKEVHRWNCLSKSKTCEWKI